MPLSRNVLHFGLTVSLPLWSYITSGIGFLSPPLPDMCDATRSKIPANADADNADADNARASFLMRWRKLEMSHKYQESLTFKPVVETFSCNKEETADCLTRLNVRWCKNVCLSLTIIVSWTRGSKIKNKKGRRRKKLWFFFIKNSKLDINRNSV